jgi:acetyl esterase
MGCIDAALQIDDVSIAGYAGPIVVRCYVPAARGVSPPPGLSLPLVLYFHGGGFTRGTLDDADVAASFIAKQVPAVVISVGYSLAPAHPFPAAPEDAYRAALWAVAQARAYHADSRRIGVAGHDAGGNLATCLSFMARDRGELRIAAQALLAPLLDPSMTRLGKPGTAPQAGNSADAEISDCAKCYRAYLPLASQRLHPYAAPLESRRLAGLPPTLIASAQHDMLHVEAEKYANELIAAGVPTQVTRHSKASHAALASHPAALADVVSFFQHRLAVAPDGEIPQ